MRSTTPEHKKSETSYLQRFMHKNRLNDYYFLKWSVEFATGINWLYMLWYKTSDFVSDWLQEYLVFLERGDDGLISIQVVPN